MIAELRRSGRWVRSGPVRVLWRPRLDGPPRLGYAISRKVGAAVVRNRVRRRLQAIVATAPPPPGDYLITVTPAAATTPFGELQSHLAQAFAQIRPGPDHRP